MAVIQGMYENFYNSFGSLAASCTKSLIGGFNFANTVCDVFDRYDINDSVKGEERERRAAGFGYKE